jgi:hypothetical protein
LKIGSLQDRASKGRPDLDGVAQSFIGGSKRPGASRLECSARVFVSVVMLVEAAKCRVLAQNHRCGTVEPANPQF